MIWPLAGARPCLTTTIAGAGFRHRRGSGEALPQLSRSASLSPDTLVIDERRVMQLTPPESGVLDGPSRRNHQAPEPLTPQGVQSLPWTSDSDGSTDRCPSLAEPVGRGARPLFRTHYVAVAILEWRASMTGVRLVDRPTWLLNSSSSTKTSLAGGLRLLLQTEDVEALVVDADETRDRVGGVLSCCLDFGAVR